MDKTHSDNPRTNSQPTEERANPSIKEKVFGVANVIHGAGEVIRGHVLDLSDRGKGTGKDIAAEGKAEFERGSNKLGRGRKPATVPTTSTGHIHAHTGAASGSENAGSYAAAGISTTDPSGTGRDRRTEKETTVDDGGSARPEQHDEKRPTPQTASPGPLHAARYEGQKATGTTPSFQEKQSGQTVNDPDASFAGGRPGREPAGVPEYDRGGHTSLGSGKAGL